ncbi:MAG: tRNA (adenosine(37)-N6)-threonylcarbamoyltransferase complex dimerization subunit type 1 TsaB [Proteobacteria bacterium]|nr:tRNA (adenosine(37)-N6)-threonylcarbamoyltransferase complex dimerization subunit type 1 TsaB [Pseudomonadota bacterium]
MTHWLAIDTAMNACNVGVRTSDGQLFQSIAYMDRGQSEQLMPMVQDVVRQAGLALPDIGAYAVTVGPGTFTGLRVGLATVRALSQVSSKPAIGVSTFDALAAAVPERPACILIETKRSDYYVRLFENAHLHEGMCMSPDDLRKYIQLHWILAGDAVARALDETGLTNKTLGLTAPKINDIITLASADWQSGKALPPDPMYLRGADVSISKRKLAKIV